ncbi:GNAT family N-acetyltransferase [Streptomyces sp. NPDC012403]|uniref:GNAT family N-acetyltransferase n=1 Tax=Streptomyces sp. NPDC012403 TaxID=3364831 RepID=UPI0036E179AF
MTPHQRSRAGGRPPALDRHRGGRTRSVRPAECADPRTYLPTLLSRPGSVHLAARDTIGRIVAVGHLMPDHTGVEAALLVEDSWQGSGLGTRLLCHVGHHAPAGGP